jgi:nucleoside-diphosphate-sugar epimerase
MNVLVTGGTGVVGTAAVRALVARGHAVRLFSRHARRDCEAFPGSVQPYEGSVDNPESVAGCATGMDAVLHMAGIVAESPPDVTFERVNVAGTRHVVEEAERSGVGRFVYVSSLGAERGQSDYHRSKRRAEAIVRRFRADWLICRSGNVYGPGDEVITLLLQMVRTLPAVPVIDDGEQPFQPIWSEDAGEALALAVEREDLRCEVLELAGTDVTSMDDVLRHFAKLTGKRPTRLAVPGWLASVGLKVAEAVGASPPVNTGQLTMLTEGNLIDPHGRNALTDVFGLKPTPLSAGLAKLADSAPEQLISEGVGRLFRRRYWADIRGTRYTARELLARFRERFASLAPDSLMEVGAEPGTPVTIEPGATLTLGLPMRGNVQVRVEEVTDEDVTFVTLAGHPLAGTIRFHAEDHPGEEGGGAVRFEVRTYDRAANLIDRVAMSTAGRFLKSSTWTSLVSAVVRESGGEAPDGVRTETHVLHGEQAEAAERWAEDLVMRRRREEAEADTRSSALGARDSSLPAG